MPLAAGSELRDELLGLVKLAAEAVPLLGRALRERLARVAGVQPADGGHALPLLGPEPPYGRRPLRIAAPAFRSRPRESHRSTQYPSRGSRTQRARLPRGVEGKSCLSVRPTATSARRAPLADVTLRSPATPVRQRFLVRAMANVALHLRRAGRGLAARVVYDAHDLAHAAAAAAIHRGTPVSDDRLRLRTAALAEHFSDGRHKRPASVSHVPPSGDGQPGRRRDRENYTGSRDQPRATCVGGEARATRRYLGPSAVMQSERSAPPAGY
jgi:hypothetical protein